MNEIDLLANAVNSNRALYQSNQFNIETRKENIQERTVRILGYSASTGLFRTIDASGRIFYAQAISNSGALGLGSQVSLVSPKGSTPFIDAMPR
jgi:hypothetical protein